ncbi:hypothetical protein KP509_36G013200 [Ceratopteris richardii]|nr:hypothetical protein KP509_36G013200 [Ceratopteris richardii]
MNSWLHTEPLYIETSTLSPHRGHPLCIIKTHLQGGHFCKEDEGEQLNCASGIRAPAFLRAEDISIRADSVKRKRKKKMNKHKHRKLRKLARRSSK